MADRYDAHAEELARWSRETGNTTAEGFRGRIPRPHAPARRSASPDRHRDLGRDPAWTAGASPSSSLENGDFRHRSNSPSKAVSSPFSLLMNVPDGKSPTRNSPRTAANFCKDGSWTVHTEPGAEPFQV
jgi:hypothetical protein